MDKQTADCLLVGMPCITLTGRGSQINGDVKRVTFSQESDKVTISETQLGCLEMWYYMESIVRRWENMCRVKLDHWKPSLLFYHGWENNHDEIKENGQKLYQFVWIRGTNPGDGHNKPAVLCPIPYLPSHVIV